MSKMPFRIQISVVPILGCWCAAALAQPVLTSVSNSASYETTIGQGSIFVAFGRNLGPAALVQASALPLETTLSGTSVRFTPASGGAPVDAFMIYTSAGQVSGILPSSAAPGNYNVRLTFNGQTSAAFQAAVVSRAFGMFTLASSGRGPAVLQNAVSATELVVNRFTSPARPGQVMILYGTGLGPITVPDNSAPGSQDLLSQAGVRVIVGGREIVPLYAGRSPGLPGVDQINFALPADAPAGCTIPLQVRAGGVTTMRPVSLAVAAAGASICTHPFLPQDAIRKLASGESLTVASLNLLASEFTATVPIFGDLNIRDESFSGAIERINLSNAAADSPASLGLTLQTGTCIVNRQRIEGFSIDPVEDVRVESLDAGAALMLNGPNVSNRSVPRGSDNQYDAELIEFALPLPGAPPPPPVIARGQYTVTAPGGTGVQPFTARTDVPDRPVWTNRADITAIRRSSPLTINWTGGGANDIAVILGGGGQQVGGTADDPIYEVTLFVCQQRAPAGTFTVPTAVLSQLPAVQLNFLNLDSVATLGLLIQPPPESGRFSANLTAGGSVDYAYFQHSFGSLKLLSIE